MRAHRVAERDCNLVEALARRSGVSLGAACGVENRLLGRRVELWLAVEQHAQHVAAAAARAELDDEEERGRREAVA